MGLMDFIKKQFIDVLQWTEEDDGVLVWRYPMADFEIQYGASLTVRESQLALFVNEGQIADVFRAGMYKLETRTLPVLTNLKHWDKLFESPFKSDVYFFSARTQLDRKWGTPNPITLRDKEFGVVRLRAFGIYSYHITDPSVFYRKISGSRDLYTRDELEGQLRNTLIAGITDLFAESGVPFLDMAANQNEFAERLRDKMQGMFADFGLALDSLVVQNISLPEELQQVLDQRISMNMLGDLNRYTQYQVANSIPTMAANENGLAGLSAGVGAGLSFGQVIGQAMSQAISPMTANPASSASPATSPNVAAAAPSADEIMATLEKLHGLMEKGILSADEFAAKKAELLQKLV